MISHYRQGLLVQIALLCFSAFSTAHQYAREGLRPTDTKAKEIRKWCVSLSVCPENLCEFLGQAEQMLQLVHSCGTRGHVKVTTFKSLVPSRPGRCGPADLRTCGVKMIAARGGNQAQLFD
eukprot:975970-Rhodomonas_salina.2